MTGGKIGVLGGMGPAATADFFSKLVQLTPASCDQEHLPIVIASLPHIPDRSGFLLGRGVDPLPALLERIALLNRMQAGLIVVPCNTSHHWFDAMAKESAAPMLHIAEACVQSLAGRSAKRVAIFATRGTLKSGFYQRALGAKALESVIPDDAAQVKIDTCIRSVKAGDVSAGAKALQKAIADMQGHGADAMIMACTEIPLAAAALMKHDAKHATKPMPLLIDSTLELARQAVAYGIQRHWHLVSTHA
jgi:aspartate racemase